VAVTVYSVTLFSSLKGPEQVSLAPMCHWLYRRWATCRCAYHKAE